MVRSEVKSIVFKVVANTFGISVDDLHEETKADDIDGWDSLAHATLLVRLEKAFNSDIGMEGSFAQDLGVLVDLVSSKVGV